MAKKKKVIDKEELKEKEVSIVEEIDMDEDYDDEDDMVENDLAGLNLKNEGEFVLEKEVKTIKFLVCIAIFISVISLFVGLITLNKLSEGTYSDVVEDEEEENSDSSDEYDVSMFESITMDDFKDMFEDDEKYFVFVGRSTCGYCVAFLPYLQKSVEDYDYTLYYLNAQNLTSSDVSDAVELDSSLKDTFSSTPMVYVIEDGEVVDVNKGYTDYDVLANFLEDNGVKEKK